MVTLLSDLWPYDEPMPDYWQKSIDAISAAGANKNLIEAEKLKMQIALMSTQATVDLFVDEQAERRSVAERKAAAELSAADILAAAERATAEETAARARAKVSDGIATSLKRATWVLAFATVGLAAGTIVLAVATIILAAHGG